MPTGSLLDNPEEILYELPAGIPRRKLGKAREWHKKMAAMYVAVDERPHDLLKSWLQKAGIPDKQMADFGIGAMQAPEKFRPEFFTDVLEHCRVIKHREDGALYVLGEPFSDLEEVERSPFVAAWRSIEAPVFCSTDTGWMPGRSITVLIGAPRAKRVTGP